MQSNDYPLVILNKTEHYYDFSGESYMEDPSEFYNQQYEKIHNYFANSYNGLFTVNFKVRYFNTSSAKCLLELLQIFNEYRVEGKNIIINWYYPQPDIFDMLAEGEDLQNVTGLSLNFISYPLQK
jgi:hypothetical protein